MKGLPASALIMAGLAGFAGVGFASFVAALPPPTGEILLVVVPPWHDATAVVAAAGGQVATPDRAPLSVLATGTSAERLRRAGAVLVADGTWIASLCGAEEEGQSL